MYLVIIRNFHYKNYFPFYLIKIKVTQAFISIFYIIFLFYILYELFNLKNVIFNDINIFIIYNKFNN